MTRPQRFLIFVRGPTANGFKNVPDFVAFGADGQSDNQGDCAVIAGNHISPVEEQQEILWLHWIIA